MSEGEDVDLAERSGTEPTGKSLAGTVDRSAYATRPGRRVAARLETTGTESPFAVTSRARAMEAEGRSIVDAIGRA